MISSKDIEAVLRVFKDAEEQASLAYDEQRDCEDKQNDILHEFEFLVMSHNERGRLGKTLAEVRKSRRAAKNAVELLGPLCEWITNYKPAINALKRTLGDMRKIEDRQANRTYRLKTDGKGEIIGVKRQETEVDHAD